MYGGMPISRVGTAAARRHGGGPGGTVAHQVTRWYGGFTVVHQRARSCHGAALGEAPNYTATRLRHVCGRWHGWMVCQVARCDGG